MEYLYTKVIEMMKHAEFLDAASEGECAFYVDYLLKI